MSYNIRVKKTGKKILPASLCAVIFLLILPFVTFIQSAQVVQASIVKDCEELGIRVISKPETINKTDDFSIKLNMSSYQGEIANPFYVLFSGTRPPTTGSKGGQSTQVMVSADKTYTAVVKNSLSNLPIIANKTFYLSLYRSNASPVCVFGTVKVEDPDVYSCRDINVYQEREVNGVKKKCYAPGCITGKGNGGVFVSGQILKNGEPAINITKKYRILLDGGGLGGAFNNSLPFAPQFNDGKFKAIHINPGVGRNEFTIVKEDLIPYLIGVPGIIWSDIMKAKICPSIVFHTSDSCAPTACQEVPTDMYTDPTSLPFRLCGQINQLKSPDVFNKCKDCVGSDSENPAGIWTAIGCIPTEKEKIIYVIIKLGLGMGGGLALLLILASAFQLSVSQGDPKQTNEAKDKITGAVVGLLFIIFSVTILQFIGVRILQIPGFGN